jgi:hypothetical protein
LEACSKNLKQCFAKVARHDEAILMEDLERYIDPELIPFVQKNMTEYFGMLIAAT